MEACRAASRGSRSQFAIPLSTLTIDEALAIALATGAMHRYAILYESKSDFQPAAVSLQSHVHLPKAHGQIPSYLILSYRVSLGRPLPCLS